MNRHLHVVFERDAEGYYVACVPALPGCHTQARSLNEISERIEEAIRLYLEVEGKASEPLDFIGVPGDRITFDRYDEEYELERYIWRHCTHLMTDLERRADRLALARAKAGAGCEERKQKLLKFFDVTEAPDLDRALSAGWEAFRKAVFRRILSEHGDAILNRCPRCRRIVRTPMSEQCFWCGHDWHKAAR